MKCANVPPKHNSLTSKPPSGRVLIYGKHAVTAALHNKLRYCHKLFATKQTVDLMAPLSAQRNLSTILTDSADIDRIIGYSAVHQGILLETSPLPKVFLDELDKTELVIMLDQVTDPRNAGAILRSAAAFGAAAVIGQKRHAPPPSGALAKAAAGALEHIPYLQVTNISRTLTWFTQQGRWIIGLDDDGNHAIETIICSAPIVLVLGAEGSGLRRLTKNHCDFIAHLDLTGPIKTLNVSNAAAIALYAIRRSKNCI